jgi:elongation factor P--(R)-beta-lysine ligase
LREGHGVITADPLASDFWRPTAGIAALKVRAAMLAAAREFFATRNVLEVETPILSLAAVSDPQLESLKTQVAGLSGPSYLCSSPEYAMKRLLAAGSGDIYQICKVFRDEEHGRWHNPEFTMVEWYRQGFNDAALMTEVEALVGRLLAPHRALESAERLSYAAAFRRHASIDVHTASDHELRESAVRHRVACGSTTDRDATLDLLMALIVGPALGRQRPCFVYDYPASQAALARIKPGLPAVAARFELYLDGIELANGFEELLDPGEQRARFERDLQVRRALNRVQPPLDERLLAALHAGMPACAGVALGFDRVVALALRAARLQEAMAFSIDNG